MLTHYKTIGENKENTNFAAKIDRIKEQASELSSICQLLYGICSSNAVDDNFQYLYIFTRIINEQSKKLKNDIDNIIAI